MTRNRWLAGAVAGVVLGAGGVLAITAATEPADAQSGFKVTAGQLQINQKISQAAVRRSNQSLNYLAPIRTTASDNADTGRNGVTPLSRVAGSGDGWTSGQIANKAITQAKINDAAVGTTQIADLGVTNAKIAGAAVDAGKIADGAVTTDKLADNGATLAKLGPGQKQYWATVTGTIPPVVTAQSDPGGGITATRINAGNYRVNFGTDVSGCSFTASPNFDVGAGAATSAQTASDATNNQQVAVRTITDNVTANTAVDATFNVHVLC